MLRVTCYVLRVTCYVLLVTICSCLQQITYYKITAAPHEVCDAVSFKLQLERVGVSGLGFEVWGLGFGVWGLGFGVWGLGFGVWDLGFGVYMSTWLKQEMCQIK